MKVYTDAAFAGSVDDYRSTTGYCAFVFGGLVSWKCSKQDKVSRSSAEAEFWALADGASEGQWIYGILCERRVKYSGPIHFYCDNKIIYFHMRPLFRARWKRLEGVIQHQQDVFLPLIESRHRERQISQRFCYLDSLLALELAEEGGRKLSKEEIFFLCVEFFDGGAETTSTALEWIMANHVKQPDLQERLFKEVGSRTEEENLHLRPFLKAVVVEGLRHHSHAHFLIIHSTTEEMRLVGYTIPKGTTVNFGVEAMNLDEGTWREPLKFRLERFLDGRKGE
ncbi:cytochrome P450 89A2-like [Wolffia australiana]